MFVAMVTAPRRPAPAHDLRLLLDELRVEHVVHDALAFEHAGEQLARFHRDGADEHRLALGVRALDLLDDGVVFLAPRLVDAVVEIDAGDPPNC